MDLGDILGVFLNIFSVVFLLCLSSVFYMGDVCDVYELGVNCISFACTVLGLCGNVPGKTEESLREP